MWKRGMIVGLLVLLIGVNVSAAQESTASPNPALARRSPRK